MRKSLALLLVLLVFVSCGNKPSVFKETIKLEGVTQLLLAANTETVYVDSTIEKLKIFPGVSSKAEIRVTCNTTYNFYVDLDNDEYELLLDKEKKELTMNAPAIKMQKPIVNQTEVSYLDTGLFVNEDREALQIHQNLTDRLVEEGKDLVYEPQIRDKCREKLHDFLLDFSGRYGHEVETVVVTFADDPESEEKVKEKPLP